MNDEKIINDDNVDARERVYEFAYLISSALDKEQVEKELNNIKQEIQKISKEIITESNPELIELAYTIKVNDEGKNIKHDTAYFGWIKFVASPESLDEFKEELKFNKAVIRYLLIQTVREDTRAQLEEDAMRKLEEVKTTSTISQKPEQEQPQQDVDEEDIDKIVEDLLAKIDDDIEEEAQEANQEQTDTPKTDTKEA